MSPERILAGLVMVNGVEGVDWISIKRDLDQWALWLWKRRN